MANPEHVAILQQGIEVWNEWKKDHPEAQPDLTRIDVSELSLAGADFGGADLEGTKLPRQLARINLNGTRLNGVNLAGAMLTGATMRHAEGRGAILSMAKLTLLDGRSANFCGADFTGSDLRLADLSQANLSDAIFGDSIFGGTSFRNVEGLHSCAHISPSTIDLRTLARSGPLPSSFLRGCGLPDRIIDYLPSLLQQPFQFHSCFISYSTKDQDFADRLYADLQAKGVRCWFAPHDIKGGRKIHEQIDEAIRLHDKLLLILSPHSMASEWVKTEISKARKREVRDKARVLFPISLAPFDAIRDWEAFDADTGKDSAREIREYFIPDFSNWKNHDSYQQAFGKLMRDLQAKQPAPAHTRR
jgi:uncharacterized protein YjbI with pentapeptide repeats